MFSKLKFPTTFNGGLIGVEAKEDIEHREAFVFVPFRILISLSVARNDAQIGYIFKDNPQFFSKENDDFEQLTLTIFLLHEY